MCACVEIILFQFITNVTHNYEYLTIGLTVQKNSLSSNEMTREIP